HGGEAAGRGTFATRYRGDGVSSGLGENRDGWLGRYVGTGDFGEGHAGSDRARQARRRRKVPGLRRRAIAVVMSAAVRGALVRVRGHVQRARNAPSSTQAADFDSLS